MNEDLWAMNEDLWESSNTAPPFLNLALDVDEQSASCPCYFTTGERIPSTHWTGAWVGPRAGLDAVENGKNLLPLLGTGPQFNGQSACSLLLY
jgi:hypothetical protein